MDNFFVQSGSAGGGRLPEPAQKLPAGYHLRTNTTPMRSCTLRAGTRKVRGFATGQGRGWPWSKTPSCRRLRPGGAYGKRSYEALTEQLNITSRCITRSRQDLRARDTLPYLTTFFRGTAVDARSYTMMRYVMMRIPGTHAPTKHRRSPGVHCTSLGRLGGDEPARLTDAKPGTKDRQGLKWRVWRLPTVTAFPLKVRWQGAGLEQTGAAGGPLVRGLERVCGRLRRPQSRRCVAVRAEVPWAAKVPRGLEPSWRDWRRRRIRAACGGAGTNASLTAFRVGGRGSDG